MSRAEIARAIRATIEAMGARLRGSAIPYTAETAAFVIGGDYPMPPHEVLNRVRLLTGAAEESDLPEAIIERMREAYQEACILLGDPNPPEGNYRHEAVQLTRAMVDEARGGHHAGAMSEYLQSLMEFHLIDDDHQAADPLVNIERITADELAVSTESGRRFTIVVNEAP